MVTRTFAGFSAALARLDPYLLLLLTLSLLALTPLAAPGYFYSAHDGRHSVFYLIMFDAALRDGALWPRWAMHHIQGYGYPTFIIQAPLGFYLAEIFVLLGASYTQAAKWAWVTGFLGSAWGIYALVIHWTRSSAPLADTAPRQPFHPQLDSTRLAGLVAGLLYVFIPYHLVQIYVRAALNDTLLLAWFPWVLLAFDRLIAAGTDPGWPRRLVVAALALAGTLLTHTFALISFAPFLVTFVLFRLGLTWRTAPAAWWALTWRTLLAATGGIAALLLCASFLLPLFVEGQHLQQQVYVTDTYDFRRHFVHFGQWFSPFWGFGYSDDPAGANDGMSFQIGVMAVLTSMVGIYGLWQQRAGQALLMYLAGATLALLFLMSPAARPLWEAVPLLGVIQFPWRLLALVALTASALGGLALWRMSTIDPSANSGILLIGLLIVIASAPLITAPLQPVEPWREDGRAIFRFEREHPDMIAYTEWVEQPFTESPMTQAYADDAAWEAGGGNATLPRLAITQGGGQVISHYSRGSSFGGVVAMVEPGVVRIHVLYFPGWQVWVDGVLTPHRVAPPHGLVEVAVPAGEHRIDARMGSTPVRRLGTGIAWATWVVLVGLAAGGHRLRTRPHTRFLG
jgi:hypothetical protein